MYSIDGPASLHARVVVLGNVFMMQTGDQKRTQLIANLQEQAEELQQMKRIAMAHTAGFGLHELLRMITEAARKVTVSEFAACFLLSERGHEDIQKLDDGDEAPLHLAAACGATRTIEKRFRQLGTGLLHSLVRHASSIVVADLRVDPRFTGLPESELYIRSLLGVQLRTREGMILGMFLVGDTRPYWFSAHHVELVEALGAQASVAIHNEQLVSRERQAMQRRAAGLEKEVRERTAELERRNQELSQFAAELQALHLELTEAQKREMLSEERNRIAQELHDRVQQTLFTIGLKADWLIGRVPTDSPLIRTLHSIKQLASLGTVQVRDAIYALSSSGFKEGGLSSMFYTLIQDLRETSSMEVDLIMNKWEAPLPPRVENVMYTFVQEALSNVRRHSQATAVVVTIEVSREQVVLVVQDNGIGIPEQVLKTYRENTVHLGLKGMHRRAEEVGGQFWLMNGEEGGLIVKAVIPL